MDKAQLQEIFSSPYDQRNWVKVLREVLKVKTILNPIRSINIRSNNKSISAFELGSFFTSDERLVGLYEIKLSKDVKIEKNRVALRELLRDIYKYDVDAALVVFVQEKKWRFSFISEIRTLEEEKKTDTKRFTYLFGEGETSKTAAERFVKLNENPISLFDLFEAFNVDKLGKEFFKYYKETYEDFVQFITGKRFEKKGNKYVEQIIHEPNWQFTALFNKDDKEVRDFCKRMMGRIVFLYFIQKKGWLAVEKGKKWGDGDINYLYNKFTESKNKDDFYFQELVPLFFRTLNDPDSENEARNIRFPYLNGGLFDDAQDRDYNKLQLPEETFTKLFETFNNYNFTIYEDAPGEQTVAVDPEMLGHIFENLLEDNKDKGAFYTPKEIVHFMCKESIKSFLYASKIIDKKESFQKSTLIKILEQKELDDDEKDFAINKAFKILDALDHMKICDPAIGSGAFPMGLLLEIFNIQVYLQELKGFKKNKSDAEIKKHIIEENIYGVDIDSGAVDISRLRFWLSLVVDEERPQPLPNLNFKIVCANTLIPLGELKHSDFDPRIAEIFNKLEKLRHDFFSVNNDEKIKLERKFKELQTELLELSAFATKENNIIYNKVIEFNPFEDVSCSWFDPWWMFGVKDGFDIVIGNPPYVQLQKDGGKLAKLYQSYKYETFERTGDIYSLFYERGIHLLNEKGILCFITSNKWMRANYGSSTRQFFADKTYPLLLIDFGNVQVFETATVDTNILILENKPKIKKNESKETIAVRINKDFNIEDQSLQEFVSSNGYTMASLNQNAWVVGEKDIYNIKGFVENQGIELKSKSWNIKINRGLLTGYNEAFIIPEKIKERLVTEDPRCLEILKPVLRGKDIYSWYPIFANLWLINSHNGIKSKGVKRVNVEKDYPAIFNWFLSHQEKMKNRTDQGDEWTNLRNCAYIEDFDKPKIVYVELSKYLPFVYDKTGEFYIDKTCFFITGDFLPYLTCFLNSKLYKYCFSDDFSELQGGTRVQSKVFFEKIPVKQITIEQEEPYAKIVDYLITIKKEKSQEPQDQFMFTYFEQIANSMIFELYFKDEFEKRDLQIANYISDLPYLNNTEKPLHQIRKIYVTINHEKHPLKRATFNMLAIPQIQLIMNSK